MELSWTEESKELSSGNSWAVNCEEGELGDKMVIEVDITKFRVQPFKSYKVCMSLEDSSTDSHLDEVCTHLFSFRKYVPYVPHEKVIKEKSEKKSAIDVSIRNEDNKTETKAIVNDIKANNIINAHSSKSEKSHSSKVGTEDRLIKQKLKDIENFVRDDFMSEFVNMEEKILEEFEYAFQYSNSVKFTFSHLLLYCTYLLFL